MDIFQQNTVIHALSCPDFITFIKKIEMFDSLGGDKILQLPWPDAQTKLTALIVESLTHWIVINETPVPEEGLKGVYFCLGYEGAYLDICGSLYFNETDWAANADFSPRDNGEEILQLMLYLSSNLLSIPLPSNKITDLMYLFVAFVINKAMEQAGNIDAIAHAGISLGFNDGDELILGHFVNKKFVQDIKIIDSYENPSTDPEYEPIVLEPRGDLWHYLQHNYSAFIKEQGLADLFIYNGEQEAERILETFKKDIFVNHCAQCNFIKKTPKAQLCLNCGAFEKTGIST
jgi:hypothetical protein